MKLNEIILASLEEDQIQKDRTTELFSVADKEVSGSVISKNDGVFSGVTVIETAGELFYDYIEIISHCEEGDKLKAGTKVIEFKGKAGPILSLERTLLNFLARLTGIATLTREYFNAIQGTDAVLLDTRKTTPLMREIEKQAVLAGGGRNHRKNLGDGILIKENHIAALGGFDLLIDKMNEQKEMSSEIMVEVDSLKAFGKILKLSPGVILLDNFTVRQVSDAVKIKGESEYSSCTKLEASGGIDLYNIREYADTGVERISVGSIVHQATWHDYSLIIEG